MRVIRNEKDIELDPIEAKVIDTPEVQRLTRLHTLHLVPRVFPGATHSRFSRALRRLEIVRRIIRESRLPYKHEEVRLLRLAALLADVGAPCFEKVLGPALQEKIPPAREMTVRILQGEGKSLWKNHSLLPASELESATWLPQALTHETAKEVANILAGKRPGLSELIHGSIDANNLTYIVQDAKHLGLESASYDHAIFSAFTLEDEGKVRRLKFRDHPIILSAIDNVLYSRWHLHRYAYLHHAVMAANAMLAEAVRCAIPDENLSALYVLGDQDLLLAIAQGAFPAGPGRFTGQAPPDLEEGRRLATRILLRRLYKRCYAAPVAKINSWEKLAREPHALTQQLRKATRQHVLVGYPLSPVEPIHRNVQLASGTKLEKAFEKSSVDADVIRYDKLFRQMNQLFVYADTADRKVRKEVREACERFFEIPSTYDIRGGEEAREADLRERIERAIDEIESESPRARKVLELLAAEDSLSLSRVRAQLNIVESTASHYVRIVRSALARADIPLKMERDGKRKVWRLADQKSLDEWKRILNGA